MEFHRGRLIDHLLVSVKDIDVSRAFFEPVLAVLEVPIDREGEDWFLADELMVVEEKRRFGRVRIALQARSNERVDEFYDVALEAGGKSKSAPDFNADVHPYYYSAAVADPDGNIVEVVCHGPIKRSAGSVVLKPSSLELIKSFF